MSNFVALSIYIFVKFDLFLITKSGLLDYGFDENIELNKSWKLGIWFLYSS